MSTQKERIRTNMNKTIETSHTLTTGNIYAQLVRLSFPLILGNILQQFYNTIDALVVGRFAGSTQFAAVGVAGTVMNLFLFLIIGACTGLSVLFARFYGTGDSAMLHRQHFTALVTGLCFSLLLSLIGLSGMHLILKLITTPDSLFPSVCSYLKWIFFSLPLAFLYNLYASALRASGDTTAALLILAIAVFCNLGLDILFVAQIGLGITGAAIATALTQLISAAVCILYLVHQHKEFIFCKKDCILTANMVCSTLQCSLTTAVHQGGLYIGKLLIQGTVNHAGEAMISAFTAATRIEGFANSFADSLSASTSILTSQNYGAGHPDRLQKIFRKSMLLSILTGSIQAVLLYSCSAAAVRILIGNHAAGTCFYAETYLKWIACFYLFCFIGSVFTGYNNGLGKVHITLAGSIGQITLRVILSWIFFSSRQLHAVAIATGIGWIAACIFWSVQHKADA